MTTGAVFLDRDGTINEEMGYINHPNRFIIFPYVAKSIRIFNTLGLKVIIITNQSGVARGYFSESLVNRLHEELMEKMKDKGAIIDAVYYCPHHPREGKKKYKIDCPCRKPKPGMILNAVKDHEIDLSRSFMIGDRYQDIVFAKGLRMKSGFVLTGYGLGEYTFHRKKWKYDPDFTGNNLLDIAKQIKAYIKESNT